MNQQRVLQLLVILMCMVVNVDAGTVYPAATTNDLNNPHKGFMLWGTDYADGAPANHHGATIYHIYMPWREIETADQVFDWDAFEANHLAPITNDHPNATFVLRPVADYPDGSNSGMTLFYTGGELTRDYPKFLELAPLNIGFSDYTDCDGDGPGRTPDWNDAAMITQMTQFISAIQARYDGDPRITCIQVGLLGLWGEWHQSGCESAAPGAGVKAVLRDHYASVFTNTLLQTRYPRNPDSIGVSFGFHEDYFPSFTGPCNYGFPQCDASGDWNMYYCFQNINPAAATNWMTSPVSGESPLTSQKNAWINDTADILTVLRDYHFSFLGPAGKHESSGNATVLQTIKRTLGYNLHINAFTWPDEVEANLPFEVSLVVTNSGSAPCYHPFPVELALCDGAGQPVWTELFDLDLRTVQPGSAVSVTESFTLSGVADGSYSVRIGILNPRSGNQPGILIQSAGRDSNDRYTMGPVTVQPAGTVDADTDGLPDAWEQQMLGSTTNAPEVDTDGDGHSNLDEFVAGTDPSNVLSRFTVHLREQDGKALVETSALEAAGVGYAGTTRYYQLQSRASLHAGLWADVPGYANIPATGQQILLTNDLLLTSEFFRARVRLE